LQHSNPVPRAEIAFPSRPFGHKIAPPRSLAPDAQAGRIDEWGE
jgi:hypothetical protein